MALSTAGRTRSRRTSPVTAPVGGIRPGSGFSPPPPATDPDEARRDGAQTGGALVRIARQDTIDQRQALAALEDFIRRPPGRAGYRSAMLTAPRRTRRPLR
ncbi:hypothetical protein Snoj_29790 [Streptomyces nojiriensis]|uniref:Uncharacterized protein n=1 Tax=Streptomyces nojiriensis TaxID=66374 RepID=A0ABQ3SLP7_9ACTN|nr:hypothetical protein GCM10010205_51970 [Streptomyces nojiriensis]GHI69061.1 hypothetical protein Snoj_29790 [Streptomyces nojiriensis]